MRSAQDHWFCHWQYAPHARGRCGGRKRQMSPEKVQTASTLMANQRLSIPEICKALGVSRSTLYRYVGPRGEIRVP
jgi:DNA invertase Pin-like site-specific DNA recombinase